MEKCNWKRLHEVEDEMRKNILICSRLKMLLIKIEDECVVPQKSVRDCSRDSVWTRDESLGNFGTKFFLRRVVCKIPTGSVWFY